MKIISKCSIMKYSENQPEIESEDEISERKRSIAVQKKESGREKADATERKKS